jgi:Ca2+-binding EF-hand superfamily protein
MIVARWAIEEIAFSIFFHMASSSSSSDLLIRETILGVIKSRDLNREGIIHTSDFRAAVSDLGFPFGHPIIENILVHCVINSDGFVDFKGLERELARYLQLSFTS